MTIIIFNDNLIFHPKYVFTWAISINDPASVHKTRDYLSLLAEAGYNYPSSSTDLTVQV